MINEVLVFLRDHLNTSLSVRSGLTPEQSVEDKVVFVDGEKMDPITFKLGAVTELLVNIEEENTLRPADLYTAVSSDGTRRKVEPEIRMNLFVLFVARFKKYEDGLSSLSQIIQHFQNNRVLNHDNAPELSDRIDRLILELITLPFSEQNEMWNALRTTYHPSVLYKVKMVVFRDGDAAARPAVSEKEFSLSP